MQQQNKNGILKIIVLATIFGLASGVVGGLVARSYLLNYNLPFFGEISFPNGNYGKANIIIRDAKKVVVEQDAKIIETINSVDGSLVGIFKKKSVTPPVANTAAKNEFNLDNYYQLNNEIGQGLVITSDGWIITSFSFGQINKSNTVDDYIIITKDKKIYTIDRVANDSLTNFNFIHVKAKDFPVKRFIGADELQNGQIAVAINWDGKAWVTRISNKNNKLSQELNSKQDLIYFSDELLGQINLINNLPAEFNESVLFNLAGDIVGLINSQGRINPISHFSPIINGLFKGENIARASFGVNYIDLSRLVGAVEEKIEENQPTKGALIYKNNDGVAVVKGGAADLAGLREGDIIISFNNMEIDKDNSLADLVQSYLAGDKVNIIYLRNNTRHEIEVELKEMK